MICYNKQCKDIYTRKKQMKIHESLAAVHTSIFNEIIKKLYKIEKGGLYLYASKHKEV